MTEQEAYEVLVTAFKALDDEGRGNLRWHYEQGTRVFCGLEAHGRYVELHTGFV